MTFLLLNQTFHPDVMATGQYLSEVAVRLAERGHGVTVVAGRRAYDDPTRTFPARENWRGVHIIRIGSTAFGKGAKWRRAADFASFLALSAWRLALLPRHDVVVALTSPPLISFLGAVLARLRGSRFFYWVMDFNPDEAIAARWLHPDSLAARLLDRMSRFSLRQAKKVIALDRFMRDRIVAKGIAPANVAVIPPWAHDVEVKFDPAGRERFRKAHGLEGRFVVMYSGNHSPCHPLETLLAAAHRLASDPGIAFCFVGGGSEWRKIKEESRKQKAERGGQNEEGRGQKAESRKQKVENGKQEEEVSGQWSVVSGKGAEVRGLSTLNSQASTGASPGPSTKTAAEGSHFSFQLSAFSFSNITCLPYQPLDQLAGSLSAADLHVTVMGNAFVGLVHPCKIYNILSVASPVLYIGPKPSHLSELLDVIQQEHLCGSAAHGEVDRVVQQIEWFRRQAGFTGQRSPLRVCARFSKEALLPRLIEELESR